MRNPGTTLTPLLLRRIAKSSGVGTGTGLGTLPAHQCQLPTWQAGGGDRGVLPG